MLIKCQFEKTCCFSQKYITTSSKTSSCEIELLECKCVVIKIEQSKKKFTISNQYHTHKNQLFHAHSFVTINRLQNVGADYHSVRGVGLEPAASGLESQGNRAQR